MNQRDKDLQKQKNESGTSLAKAFHNVVFIHQNSYHEEIRVYGTFKIYFYGLSFQFYIVYEQALYCQCLEPTYYISVE